MTPANASEFAARQYGVQYRVTQDMWDTYKDSRV